MAARCFPPGVPRAGPAAPELEKLKVPCLCPAVRSPRALPAGVGERGEGYQQEVLGEVFSNAYHSETFGIKASGFCAPIFFSAQLSWAPSTPTRPRASCCWTRKSNPHHSKTPDAYKRPGSACQKTRVCFKTIKLTKADCKREKQPHESRRISFHTA